LTILLNIASYDLGSVFKDAVYLARIEQLGLNPRDPDQDSYCSAVLNCVDDYHRLSESVLRSEITVDMVVRILRTNRVVRHFVDLYATIKFDYLRKEDPMFEPPLRTSERRRISQAFIRRQVLLHLWGGYKSEPLYLKPILELLMSILEPWEMEQVCAVERFVDCILRALVDHFDGFIDRDTMRQLQSYRSQFYSNLSGLRRLLLCQIATDGSYLSTFKNRPALRTPNGLGGPTPFLYASHEPHSADGPLRPSDDPIVLHPVDFVNDSPKSPSYAWVDAQAGLNTNRYGLSLLPPPPAQYLYFRYLMAKDRFDFWGWIGFVFWDKDRVEKMKNMESLAAYRTGWLARIWDDCNTRDPDPQDSRERGLEGTDLWREDK
jgi:hypothetical protein